MKEEKGDRNEEKVQDIKLWGVFLFGLIGATVTTLALSRSQSSCKGGSGSSFRLGFQEEACKRHNRSTFQEEVRKRYNKRLHEECEEEMERLERIRRMQGVFNREREKYRRSYERWRENGSGADHQNFQRDDWYWKAEASFRDQWANYQRTPRESGSYSLSHHYSVLGLDRFRTVPYTDAEIKTAFRTKAKQHHPDQNQHNREAAEAKFKEIICSYEAIRKERKNQNL